MKAWNIVVTIVRGRQIEETPQKALIFENNDAFYNFGKLC